MFQKLVLPSGKNKKLQNLLCWIHKMGLNFRFGSSESTLMFQFSGVFLFVQSVTKIHTIPSNTTLHYFFQRILKMFKSTPYTEHVCIMISLMKQQFDVTHQHAILQEMKKFDMFCLFQPLCGASRISMRTCVCPH